jgi:glutaredoxin-like protein NrdH
LSDCIIYTRTVCRLCDQMKVRMKAAGIEFDTINLDLKKHEEARVYVTEVLGARSVPVVVSDVFPPILGFQPEKIKLLKKALTLNEGKTDGP